MPENDFPPAYPHGEIKELFNDIFFVTGSVKMALAVPMCISRNMVIIRNNNALTLINSVRLNEDGLQTLEKLGKVEHVIRLAGFHGMDDPFYKQRYNATVWAIKNQPYVKGLKPKQQAGNSYFQADHNMDEQTTLPIDHATLYQFKSPHPGEGLLLLKRDGGILISGDCLQNWQKTDRYFNFFARVLMKAMGFIKPYNIGPGWLKAARPDPNEIKNILDLSFEHVLPCHGEPVLGNAKTLYKTSIDLL